MDNIEKSKKILRSGIPWLILDIDFDVRVWQKESLEAIQYYEEYRESDSEKWSGCCLHGLDINKSYTADKYGYDEYSAPYIYTELAYRCPTITNFWKTQFPAERYTRIRFMKLGSGGKINWHTDGSIPEHIDPLQSILPINVAIIHPKECDFKINDKTVPWTDGKIMIVNISQPHAVFNHSGSDRIHMIANIILGNRTVDFCNMLVRCYEEQYGKV